MTRKRVSNFVPWFSISSTFQPAPMPNSKRPPEIRSSVATVFAVTIGSRSVSRLMPVPSRSFLVRGGRGDGATKGSSVCAYCLGSSAPPGQGDAAARRDVGVLGHEQRFVAVLLERPRDLDDGHRVVGREVVEADLHGSMPPRGRGAQPRPRRARRLASVDEDEAASHCLGRDAGQGPGRTPSSAWPACSAPASAAALFRAMLEDVLGALAASRVSPAS